MAQKCNLSLQGLLKNLGILPPTKSGDHVPVTLTEPDHLHKKQRPNPEVTKMAPLQTQVRTIVLEVYGQNNDKGSKPWRLPTLTESDFLPAIETREKDPDDNSGNSSIR